MRCDVRPGFQQFLGEPINESFHKVNWRMLMPYFILIHSVSKLSVQGVLDVICMFLCINLKKQLVSFELITPSRVHRTPMNMLIIFLL